MKLCVHNTSSACSPTLLPSHSFSAYTDVPCSLKFLSSLRKTAGNGYASLSWVRVQRRRSKPFHLTVFFLNGDGAYGRKHADDWYTIDVSQVKLLTLEVLKRWGPPVAVGAMVGSIIAQKTVIFCIAFSFVVLMAAHNAMETQGMSLNRVSDIFSRDALTHYLRAANLILSRVILHLSHSITACLRSSSMYTGRLLVPMHSFLAGKQRNKRDLLSWNQRPAGETGKNSASGSHSKSVDTVITDIEDCIQNVDGIILTEKNMPLDINWVELKDSLASLKTQVAILSKGDRYLAPSSGVSVARGPDIKVSVKKLEPSAPVDSVVVNPDQQETDKMRALKVDDLSVMKAKVKVLKQDAMHQKAGESDVLKGLGDDSSFPGRGASTRWAPPAANEAAVDQESGLLFKESKSLGDSETQPLDAVASAKTGEHKTYRSLRTRYIDYWIEQDQNGSVSSSDVDPTNSSELSTTGYYQSKGLDLQGTQDLWKESGYQTVSPNLEIKSTFFDEHVSNVNNNKVGSRKTGNANELFVSVYDACGAKEHATSLTNETTPRNPGSMNGDDNIEGGWTGAKDTILLRGRQNHTVNAKGGKTGTLEQAVALLGSTKELAFVRDADLHVLTGFSRKINDGEFQKLMNDGETALRCGKAGLFGDLEVEEAETMLYEAADHFASAAALDLSSVEAVGFWGNTLLVHGELKLMLSRELRHMISTPDVISPYWMRKNKGTEGSNLAALQKSFQAVCEECEELLVEAGRKYRRVLSISNSEVRALYNWGLALCFRAQLISEEGGQDAREAADKIYLAAIDKFEAMMGISRRYAPGAMLNWGLTLKDRSRLRAPDSMEKIGLLQQAKQLLIDALRLQPDDVQIHSAFVTCSVELTELKERKEVQSKRSTKFFPRKW